MQVSTASELWTEAPQLGQLEVLGSLIRSELNQEKVVRFDMDYLSTPLESIWFNHSPSMTNRSKQSQIKETILKTIRTEHLSAITSLGSRKSRIGAILMESVFHLPEKTFARLVHDAFTELAGITDIKSPYEEHGEIFPKATGHAASDWGKGQGMIRPHSDDLYEGQAVNAMCLTVCRDLSFTPTWFWPMAGIVECLNNEELATFAMSDATYLSGTNVEGHTIQCRKPILRLDSSEGLGFRIDFRVDDGLGPRMIPISESGKQIFAKLRAAIPMIKPISTKPTTGSISILSNFKVLHGRSGLNPIMLYEGEESRILFRSKGTRNHEVCV